MCAYWGVRALPNKMKPVILKMGNGVNTGVNAFEISLSEGVAQLNVSNRYYPALAPRPGTVAMYGSSGTPLTAVNGATARSASMFVVVDGTTLKQWNPGTSAYVNIATGLTNAKAEFIEFTTAAKKYTIMANGTEKKAWDGSAVTDLTAAPATKLIAASDNRMFALLNSTIYCSDIGDITNWTTGDSDQIGLYGMIGTETALAVYNDMTIGFSDQTTHIVYGKTSDDFDPSEPIPVGNVSQRATIIHGQSGVLYWLDYGKFLAFTGGLPIDVSQKVRTYLENINYNYKQNICAGQWGKYIYLSFPYNGSTNNNLTLEYDTDFKMWYVWNVGFVNFFTTGQDLNGITTGGVIQKLNQGTADDSTVITWSHESGVMNFVPLKNLKTISDIYAVIDLPSGSTLTLSYSESVDNNDWTTLYTFSTSANEQNQRVRIPTTTLNAIKWHRLKVSGTGPSKLHYLEIHGRIHND